MRCDVTKEEEVLEMFEKIKAQTGGVDVCVNNAGLAHDAPLLAGATSDWREMIEVIHIFCVLNSVLNSRSDCL